MPREKLIKSESKFEQILMLRETAKQSTYRGTSIWVPTVPTIAKLAFPVLVYCRMSSWHAEYNSNNDRQARTRLKVV